MKKMKRLGDAELDIMLSIWEAKEPLSSVQIRGKLSGTRDWAMSTLITSLSRLVEKGYLSCDRSTGINVYTALVAEDDYKSRESKSLLERLYGNSMPKMVTNLYGSKLIDKEDIEALRSMLDALEEGEEK